MVTQNIEDSTHRNTADVFIEASSLQTTGRTIYAVYNDSGGKSCGEFVVMKLEPWNNFLLAVSVCTYGARPWDKIKVSLVQVSSFHGLAKLAGPM